MKSFTAAVLFFALAAQQSAVSAQAMGGDTVTFGHASATSSAVASASSSAAAGGGMSIDTSAAVAQASSYAGNSRELVP
ncbi:hypothetical protein CYLTODRAFT_426036 [Cylindrobasidium torrendii FP15055 ss-10]|uniref:Uncharacterized protein n=1 Tax=Cylindrobasidium torrendii FP15055 ss-10 TaxID=1314674 RepID=A0A0D7B1X1_9AGAR|nr:hypothetical protein CYLTODRAFT_426036 [Cylindrobasidium torrendii FP15055 ss-10]